jgi:hypothetical protein
MAKGVGNGSGQSHANKRRAEQQEALRERLSKGKHLEHIIEKLEEINNLDPKDEGAEFTLRKTDIYIKHKMSLVKKYIPDLSNLAVQANVENRTVLVDLSGGELDAGNTEV